MERCSTKSELQSLTVVSVADGTCITANLKLPIDSASIRLVYMLHDAGNLQISMHLDIGKKAPDIPCIGVTFGIEDKYDNIECYDKGPEET